MITSKEYTNRKPPRGGNGYSKSITLLSEPLLEFRYSQKVLDPRDGLALFGPFDSDMPSHPKNITYGLTGTQAGIDLFTEFAKTLQHSIIHEAQSENGNERLWPSYPGFEAAFDCSFPEETSQKSVIEAKLLSEASRNSDPNQRAFDVVKLYLDAMKDVKRGDENLDVILCIVPEEVYRSCRPKSSIADPIGEAVSFTQRKRRAEGWTELFVARDLRPYRYSVDFRYQLKARVLESDNKVPIQIVRESTLRLNARPEPGERGLTPLNDRAWNISTALFYKSGGKPWRLSTARDGVCYVGLVYKRTAKIHGDKTACCAAQMFLDSGDGIVLRSNIGPWYSPDTNEFHLSKREASELLTRVLNTYQEQKGKPLREVFLHYRSEINSEEYEAFKSACPGDAKVYAIRVREDRMGVHLYREGKMPIMRGSFWRINDHMGYLWAAGFKPRLQTYDGSDTPVPLRIEVQFGEADIYQVARDILSLTKLNYNECKFGDANPVTIGFSGAVGEILVSNPDVKNPDPRFKFYI